jgi:hypothetical protein
MNRKQAILADLQDRTRSDTEIARRHGVSASWVGKIRTRAGIPRWRVPPTPGRPRIRTVVPWSEHDLAYLIDHADKPVADVATALGRSSRAVTQMRHRLITAGRIPRRRVPYTADELSLLADHSLSDAEVAERTGRSRDMISRSRLERGVRGLRRPTPRPWTPEEIEHLVDWHDRPTREVAELMGRTVKAIQNQRDKLLRDGRTPPRRRQMKRGSQGS